MNNKRNINTIDVSNVNFKLNIRHKGIGKKSFELCLLRLGGCFNGFQ
jgi:hypothetical protein